jgi:hypothetical protein
LRCAFATRRSGVRASCRPPILALAVGAPRRLRSAARLSSLHSLASPARSVPLALLGARGRRSAPTSLRRSLKLASLARVSRSLRSARTSWRSRSALRADFAPPLASLARVSSSLRSASTLLAYRRWRRPARMRTSEANDPGKIVCTPSAAATDRWNGCGCAGRLRDRRILARSDADLQRGKDPNDLLGQHAVCNLTPRRVALRHCFGVKRTLFDVPHHADDSHPRRRDPLPYEVPWRQRLAGSPGGTSRNPDRGMIGSGLIS